MTVNHITTYTGRKFNPLDPDLDKINALDICHALSNICRFTGHVKEFYSVGEHSCRVHDLVQPKNRPHAILHDSSETYICDLASPLKTSREMKFFKDIENNLMEAIYTKFGLDIKEPEEIHDIDKKLRSTEQRELMPLGSANGDYDPFEDYKILPWHPFVAKFAMVDRLEKIGIKVER